MYFNTKKSKLEAHAGEITVSGVSFGFKASIQPATHAPHVGADSPRHMEPGKRAQIINYQLFDAEGNDRTGVCVKSVAEGKIFHYIHDHPEVYQRIAERMIGGAA